MKLLTNLFLDILQIVLAALAAHGINTSSFDAATISEVAGVLGALAFSHIPALRNVLPGGGTGTTGTSGGTGVAASVLLLCVGLAIGGCATNKVGKITQGEGVVIQSVNAAMGAWKTYVQSGKATQTQINNVQAAYNVYYTAQLSVEAGLISATANTSTNAADLTTAQASVTLAETSLVNLINTYLK